MFALVDFVWQCLKGEIKLHLDWPLKQIPASTVFTATFGLSAGARRQLSPAARQRRIRTFIAAPVHQKNVTCASIFLSEVCKSHTAACLFDLEAGFSVLDECNARKRRTRSAGMLIISGRSDDEQPFRRRLYNRRSAKLLANFKAINFHSLISPAIEISSSGGTGETLWPHTSAGRSRRRRSSSSV